MLCAVMFHQDTPVETMVMDIWWPICFWLSPPREETIRTVTMATLPSSICVPSVIKVILEILPVTSFQSRSTCTSGGRYLRGLSHPPFHPPRPMSRLCFRSLGKAAARRFASRGCPHSKQCDFEESTRNTEKKRVRKRTSGKMDRFTIRYTNGSSFPLLSNNAMTSCLVMKDCKVNITTE